MGQVRTVQVHRLLVADSVDQRMLELLGSKAQLFDAYARHSAVAQATSGAVDISEVQLARTIVAQEQQRLATAPRHVDEPGRGPTDGSRWPHRHRRTRAGVVQEGARWSAGSPAGPSPRPLAGRSPTSS
jgi:hypothetical protein